MTPEYDLLVVGGGVQGAGVLQAAAAAGHPALMLEERGLASGTSSKSSKLIHGGLRYLETFQLSLVRESLTEREVLLRVAPHLVHLQDFHIPVYRSTSRRPWQIRAGLSLYAALGGFDRDARFTTVPRGDWDALDGLSTDGLLQVFRYHDGQTDDAALVRAVVASARELGAALELPGELLAGTRAGEGWSVRYATGAGEERETTARVLVNAGGPWVNRVAARVSPEPPRRTIDLVGGTHIELEGVLERGIYYTEAADRRAVFSVPWKGHTMVGTTERELPPEDREPHPDMHHLAPTEEEVDYLRATFARHFPGRSTEVLRSWAGLRVLPHGSGDAFDRPRDVTLVSDAPERNGAHGGGGAPRYLGIYGGKLTGYRATAEKVMQALRRTLPRRERRADTSTLRLPADPGAHEAPAR